MLEISHLTTVFDLPGGPVAAVDDIDVQVRAGETLGLVGESGSGKSVTALSIMRLVEPPGRIAGGSIRFKGRELLGLPEAEMRAIRGAEIALIFQEPMSALNPVLTIGDHIVEALTVHGRATRRDAKTRAIELLEAVRMPEASVRADDYSHQLSGGMRQRALIATALACRPSLLIADEPTTALDVTIQAEILELLGEMKAAFNLSMLLISHDLGVIAQTADRVAVMYAGRIVEHGPVGAVFRRPEHPYTRGLLASIPGAARGGRLQAIEGSVPVLGEIPLGCAFHPRCPDRFDPCDRDAPPEVRVGDAHGARCHLHDGKNVQSPAR